MEGFFALLGLLVFFAITLGLVFGWVAFFSTRRLNREVEALRAEIRGRKPPEDRPAPVAPPQPEKAPPQPTISTPRPAKEPPRPAPGRPGANPFASLEKSLARNWLVWVAGAALALGGLFLVQAAYDAGLLGPWGQIVLALAAGAAMIAAGEWLRRNPPKAETRFGSFAPAASASAGLITIYGAAYAAYGVYELVPAPVAFGALAAVAFAAVALALAHGPALVVIGLVGGFAAPILIGSENPNAAALFAYVLTVAAGGFAVCRLVKLRWPGLVAVAGGAAWPFLWLFASFDPEQAWALAAYLPAFAIAAGAFAWRDAATPLAGARPILLILAGRRGTSLLAAWTAGLAALVLAVLLAATADHAPATIAAMVALAVLMVLAATLREGFAPLAPAAVLCVGLFLLAWPETKAALIDPTIRLNRYLGVPDAGPEGPPFLTTALLLMAFFGLGGLFGSARAEVKGWLAAVAAGGPLVMLACAFWRVTGLEQDWRWGLAALALAAANQLQLERLLRAPGALTADRGRIAAHALGASGGLAMAVAMSLDQLWMSVGFALQAPMMAWLHRRLNVRLLSWAALAAGALATARLTIFGEAFGYDVGAIPVLNWLILGYAVPAAALWIAARTFRKTGLSANAAVIQGLEGGALILAVAFISMELRHALNGARLDADYLDSLVEVSLQTATWFGAALALRWRLGPAMRFAPRWIERVLIALAVLQAVFVHLWWLNPWRGVDPAPVYGAPVVNELLLAYALPGLLAAIYAVVIRRQTHPRAGTVAGLSGAGLLWSWATLETRRAFHHPNLAAYSAPQTEAEQYAYSIVWLLFAIVLLGVGFLRRRPSLRYAALALLTVASVKVFVFDMANLEGVWRALSFIGLGAVLMGIAVFYQRIILPAAAAERADDNAE